MFRILLEKIKSFLAQHCLPLVFAFFVGVVSVLPSILAPIAIGNDYKGIPFLYQSDEETYLMRIEEVLDGHPSVSSPAYFGYKDTPALQMPFSEYVYALPAYIFGISSVIITSKFLFPFILFLLVYLFIWKLSDETASWNRRIWNGVAGGLLVTLGYDFVDVRHIFSLFTSASPVLYLHLWTRLVNPIIGALLLFSFLLTVWQFIKDSKRIWLFLSVLLLILMSGYIFGYALALTILCFLMVISFFQKNYFLSRKMLGIIIIGVIPILVQSVSIFTGGTLGTSGTMTKNGLFFTHEPLVNKLLVVAAFLFAGASFLYFKYSSSAEIQTKSIDWWWFSVAILGALFIVFNQQIVTGMTIWPQHFVQYSIPLIYCLGMIFLFNAVRNLSPSLWKATAAVIIVASVGFGLWSAGTFTSKVNDYRALQRYAPLVQWFAANAPKDCVVLASAEIMAKIPAYTSCNDYYSGYSYMGVPQDRVEYGYISLLRLEGVSPESIDAYFKENQDELVNVVFANWAQKYFTNNDPWLNKLITEQEFDNWFLGEEKRMALKYQEFFKGNFEKELQAYKISYIVIDEKEGQTLTATLKDFTKELEKINGFNIYSVR